MQLTLEPSACGVGFKRKWTFDTGGLNSCVRANEGNIRACDIMLSGSWSCRDPSATVDGFTAEGIMIDR